MNGDALAVQQTARAKINLYLHILGRRSDGMHLLDSLVVFADVGDVIRVASADELHLERSGPMVANLPAPEEDLVYRAASLLADEAGIEARAALELEKHLPIASGIGGGSADAAATIRALIELWHLNLRPDQLNTVAIKLGADVPVCLVQQASRVTGIGEKIKPVPGLPELPAVLVNSGEPIDTGEVFRAFAESSTPRATTTQSSPGGSSDIGVFAGQLAECRNDLTSSVRRICPAISNVLGALETRPACLVARMSGSGGTCFGLFATPDDASLAANTIRQDHPDWWIVSTVLNAAKV